MATRPYKNHKIEQLELLTNNPALTTARRRAEIIAELRLRTTDRSTKLLEKLTGGPPKRRRPTSLETNDREGPEQVTVGTAGERVEIMTGSVDEGLSKSFDQLRLRLLDLTKRNRMLNYPFGRSRRHVQFYDEVLEDVYSKLTADDVSLRVVPLPEPDQIPREERTEEFIQALAHARVSDVEYLFALEAIEKAGGSDEATSQKAEDALRNRVRQKLGLPPRPGKADIPRPDHARELGISANPDLEPRASKATHTDALLQTLRYPEELERELDKLRSTARLAEQESGLSTLYLSLGFLEWYETDASDKPFFAPLLLLPVKLEQTRLRGKKVFYVSATEDIAESNVSLQQFLAADRFGRLLPQFETDEGEKDQGVERYFEQVTKSIEGLHRWQIRRWLVLGHFSFSRVAIYQDISPEKWPQHPVQSELVRTLLRGSDESVGDPSGSGFGSERDYRIDTPEIEALAPVLVQNADSSQHSALVDVMRGRNLVIHGPPGTGKSQTIANVIANLMGAGKSVIFLAEKLAALEVVKRRLDQAGLGEFCLELHSDKANARSVVESLRARVEAQQGTAVEVRQDSSWRRARDTLNEYIAEVSSGDAGRTPFDSIWRSIRNVVEHPLDEAIAATSVPVLDSEAEATIRARVQVFSDLLSTYALQYGAASDSPWQHLRSADLGRADQLGLVKALRGFITAAAVAETQEEEAKSYGYATAAELVEDLRELRALGDAPSNSVLAALADTAPDRVELACKVAKKLEDAEQALLLLRGDKPLDDALVEVCMRLTASRLASDLTLMPLKAMWDHLEAREREAGICLEFVPAIAALSRALGFKYEASTLTQVATCITVVDLVRKVTPSELTFILQLQGDDPAFAALHLRWLALRDEENTLRHIFRGADASWPDAKRVEEAIETIQRPRLSRLVTKFSAEEREVAELQALLGVTGQYPTLASDLARLSRHISSLQEFAEDTAGKELFGESWLGLKTSCDDFEAGRIAREAIRGQVPSGWTTLLERILRLPVSSRQLVWDASERLGRVPSMIQSSTALSPKNVALNELTVSWQAWREDANAARIADAGRLSIDQKVSAKSLAEIGLQQRTVDDLRTELASSEVDLASIGTIIEVESGLRWREKVTRLRSNAKDVLLGPSASSTLRSLLDLGNSVEETLAERSMVLKTIERHLDGRGQDLVALSRRLIEAESSLPTYLGLRREMDELSQLGLKAFVDWASNQQLATERVESTFDTLVATRAAEQAIDGSATLSRASGIMLDAMRRSFVDQDQRRMESDRSVLRKRLLGMRPPPGNRLGTASQLTEMGLLAREFAKQTRHAKVRALLSRAAGAVRALKPCFMMSPLSLAKYVQPLPSQFDVLVIDEASQMRPEDALGAMLRCSQIVVVGDQKQLPPTSFFDRSSERSSDEDEEEIDDLDDESILERCQKVFGNVRQLKWHYRSRCESLIRFSNENFYENRLITFPAPQPGAFSIDLVRVEGFYQASRNVSEGERVAEEAIRFMRSHAKLDENDIPTLGVVAINKDQMDLIEETINRLEGDDEDVALYREKVAAKGEEFFVKNLENVQGDERDFIFISMTYGRRPGVSSVEQRFGPINSRQGHRRLNVLFSRARQRIALFTSMSSADVRPTETSNTGVHMLRRYLEYVEQAGRMSYQFVGGEPDSDFEIAVAELLKRRGFESIPQVGVSGYRIDLGVLNSTDGSRFIAGIECDGAAFHSSASARDRDRIRQDVLESLGWRILRVWSTDWFANPDAEADKLASRLRGLQADSSVQRIQYEALGTAFRAGDEPPYADGEDAGSAGVEGPDRETTDVETSVPLHDQVDLAQLLESDERLTPAQATSLLRYMRDNIIGPESNVEPHRTLLREGMIETLVSQRVTDPEDWFTRVPQYLRSGTDPVQKRDYLEVACAIVARIGPSMSQPVDNRRTVGAAVPQMGSSNAGVLSWDGGIYQRTASAPGELGVSPERLYDISYRHTLSSLVDLVIENEGPIFDDVLAVRIARLHGKDRTGSVIQTLVRSSIDRRYPRTSEDYREIVWPAGSDTSRLVPYRAGAIDDRSYDDTPEPELASLAIPYVRLQMDDEAILEKFAEQFGLQRLRAPSRTRFLRAIALARRAEGGGFI